MHVLVTDCGSAGRIIALRLEGAGHKVSMQLSDTGEQLDAAVLGVSQPRDLAGVRELRRARPGLPLLVLTRIALPEIAEVEDLGVNLMFPGFAEPSRGLNSRQRLRPLILPGTVVGPITGRPGRVEWRLREVLRSAGIRASCRENMQLWLTVTSAWLSPLRGAMVAAAQRALTVDETPDLITLAARAARERLRLLQAAHVPMDAGCLCLRVLPEAWAVAAMREIAKRLHEGGDLPWLASCEEAVGVSDRLQVFADEQRIGTPAAEFLDGFIREEARNADGGSQ